MTKNQSSTRFVSTRQEKAISKQLGMNRTPNSGATAFVKGDLEDQRWIVEAKTCMEPKKSFSIKKGWLDTLREEMYASNKDYRALCFDFGDEKDRYYILDEDTFKYIKELLDNQE